MDSRVILRDPVAAKATVAETAVLWDRFAETIESELAAIVSAELWLAEARTAIERKKGELLEDLDAAGRIEDANVRQGMLSRLNRMLEEVNLQLAKMTRMQEQYSTLKADAQRLVRDSRTLRENEKQLDVKIVAALDYIIDSK